MSTVVSTRFFDLDASNPALVAEQSYATGGSGADRYASFDQFGRVIETLWKDGATTPATLQNARYGYDQSSNRTWRENVLTTGRDNYYTYDDLYQVKSRELGDLTGTFPDYTGIQSPAAKEEDFCFDETGNWLKYDTKANDVTTLSQLREHNKVNEITSITEPDEVVDTSYDTAGNMTKVPQPGAWTEGYDVTWDGWNRIVLIEDTKTGNTVARYAYDGLARRTTSDSGESTDMRHYYYNRQWRCVEEYLNSGEEWDRALNHAIRMGYHYELRQINAEIEVMVPKK